MSMTIIGRSFSGYGVNTVTRSIAAGAATFSYRRVSDAAEPDTSSIAAPSMVLDLMPYLRGSIVPGSLRFKLGSYLYVDRAGVLYHSINPATGAGVTAGTINYATGRATVTSWPAGAWSFELQAGLVNPGSPGMSAVIGRTASRPIKSQSFSMAATTLDGDHLTAVANASGVLSATNIDGAIDIETGVYKIGFGELVDASSLCYNAVSYSYLPLDADQIGIDPVRLPSDGRVPIVRKGDLAVVGHTASRTLTVSNGQTINLGRTRLSRAWVRGANGSAISTGYTLDLDAGTITFADVTGYSQPVTIKDRAEDLGRVSDVQISGRIGFTRAISHAYPAGAVLSSCLMLGDLRARVSATFDQQSWNGTWANTVTGSAAAASYDKTTYPIEVSNAGAITERWAIVFTNTTTFQLHSEHRGVIATGNTSTLFAPINPAAGQPYMSIRPEGWGNIWATGNVLRVNTIGAIKPINTVRTVQQGAETIIDDAFELLARGDVDKA